MDKVDVWKQELKDAARPEKVKILSSFFKTYKGGYGEGDIFIGIIVPDNRKIAKKYSILPLHSIQILLCDPIHEFRLSALLALVEKFKKASAEEKAEIVSFYLSNACYINNWDLVDLSAPQIIGTSMLQGGRELLFKLSKSTNIWEQRIAIVSTYTLIKAGDFGTTIQLAQTYLNHPHDLIHKASGWMLREVGKRNEETLISFLDEFATQMPRTALRYAIEKLPDDKRQYYLKLK